MLYDPKWEKQTETKADPFSLGSLISWLEKQPSTKTYEFYNCSGACLMDQYMRATTGDPSGENYIKCSNAFPMVAVTPPYTFGAALERARKLAQG